MEMDREMMKMMMMKEEEEAGEINYSSCMHFGTLNTKENLIL